MIFELPVNAEDLEDKMCLLMRRNSLKKLDEVSGESE